MHAYEASGTEWLDALVRAYCVTVPSLKLFIINNYTIYYNNVYKKKIIFRLIDAFDQKL